MASAAEYSLSAGELDLHRLMTERVAGRAKNQHAAVAEKIIIAFELQEVKFPGIVETFHNEKPGVATPLEFLRKPGLIQFLFLDHVDRVWEHLNVADVIEMRV